MRNLKRKQTWIFMLQIQRVHIESLVQTPTISYPHCRAIKMHHQPFWRIESYAVCIFNTGHKCPELRTDKGWAGISGIYMQPHLFFFANGAQLGKLVKSAGTSGTQSCTKLKKIGFLGVQNTMFEIFIFCPKFSFDFPRKLSIFWVKNSRFWAF